MEFLLPFLLGGYVLFNLAMVYWAKKRPKQLDWDIGKKPIPAGFIEWSTLIGLAFVGVFVGAAMLLKRKPKEPEAYAPEVPPLRAGDPSPTPATVGGL